MPESNEPCEPADLSLKQRQALDLLLEHKTSKEISRVLGISPHTVDQRIESAKRKFAVRTRGELALAYRAWVGLCQRLTHDDSDIAEPIDEADTSVSEVFENRSNEVDPDWSPRRPQDEKTEGYRVVPELFTGPSGRTFRLIAIATLAVLIMMTVLVGIAIFISLTEVIRN